MPEKVFLPDMKKILLWAALAVFVGHRLAEGLPSIPLTWPTNAPAVSPSISYESLTPALKTLWQTAAPLRPEDRSVLTDFHASLSRAIAADPASDPVISDTPAFRRAYRAGLLFVWAGLAGNKANEYPGLADALDASLTEAIGRDEVILNPALRQSLAAYLNKVSAVCSSARR